MKQRNKIIFVVLLLLFGALLSFFLNFKSFTIYPVENIADYEVGTYHEEMDSNWTEAEFEIIDDKISFNYKLSEEREEPFAAFYFRDKNIDSNLLDLKGYNCFSVYLKADKAQKIPVTLRFRNDSILKLSKSFPEISVTKVIDYEKEGTYQVCLNEFEIATWWLRYHGIDKEAVNLSKFTELKYLAVGSCMALEQGAEDVIVIDQVKFLNDNSLVYSAFGGTVVLMLLIFFLVSKIGHKKKTVVVEHLEVEDHAETIGNQVAQIKNYIGKNFSDANLNMYHVQNEFKMSASEVRKIFKEEMEETFKSYLKNVRMAEVKRILQIDQQITISEVAYKCGFNDIPYFHRLFKKETGLTPKDFRKQA